MEVANHPFFYMKSCVDNSLMTIFDEIDKRQYVRKFSERNQYEWGMVDDESEETAFEYRLEGIHAQKRLDILGFTAELVREEFYRQISEFRKQTADGGWIELPVADDQADAFLEEYTFEAWSDTMNGFLKLALPQYIDYQQKKRLHPFLQLVCDEDNQDFFYGFPGHDPRLFIRAILEVCGSDTPIVMDYTDLVVGGYYDGSENLSEIAKESVSDEFVSTARLIVLTEGSTDSTFLKRSMELLRPQFAPLFSFVDFSYPNMEGGAPNLVRVLKGFIGAKVANRVLAIFDNDAAASDAIRSLIGIALPSNCAVIQYPVVSYAQSYPTIGPQGNASMNVNGLAGSIELYFGLDVLTRPDGTLTPVEWGGLISGVGKYQGVLQDKVKLQGVFTRKLNDLGAGRRLSTHDWSGMELILDAIGDSFSKMKR